MLVRVKIRELWLFLVFVFFFEDILGCLMRFLFKDFKCKIFSVRELRIVVILYSVEI